MLHLCLSFDYELFLGKNNDSFESILFSPTEQILEILRKNNVSGTFFADVYSSIVCKRDGIDDYVKGFEKQIRDIIQNKNDVQLHIHSNWLDSDMKRGYISNRKYNINEFGFDDQKEYSVNKIIKEGKAYLEKLIHPIYEGYKCVAYRAGGFCTYPEKELISCLVSNGIQIDSSVVPGMKNDGVNYYNYKKAPHNVNYWVNDSFKESSCQNGMFEVPIITFRNNLIYYLLHKGRDYSLKVSQLKGSFASYEGKKESKTPHVWKKIFNYRTLSLDELNYNVIFSELKKISKKHEKDDVFLCIISHPKLCSENVLSNMDNLIKKIRTSGLRIDFVSFREVYELISLKEK